MKYLITQDTIKLCPLWTIVLDKKVNVGEVIKDDWIVESYIQIGNSFSHTVRYCPDGMEVGDILEI